MNPRDPHHDIAALLRSRQPDPRPSPGLESRIMRALPERKRRLAWPWFALPPAVAMAVLVMLPKSATGPSRADTAEVGMPPAETRDAVEERFAAANPLEREKLALQRDASRAGRFLIDCLPSMGSAEQ